MYGIDPSAVPDEMAEGSDSVADALLQLQGGAREGFFAQPAKLVLKIVVLAESAAEASFADLGFASGCDDGARAEQGLDGAFHRRR